MSLFRKSLQRWAGTALVLTALPAGSVRGAEIEQLQVRTGEQSFQVDFRLTGAFTQEVEELLASGLPITFQHTVRALRRRATWLDRLVAERVITTTANFDTLTKQYRMSRAVDGQMVDTLLTDKPEEMKTWMTAIERVELPWEGKVQPVDRCYVKVKSEIQKRFVFFFIPWDFETAWVRSAEIELHEPVKP